MHNTYLRVNGKTNPIPKCFGFVTNLEKSRLTLTIDFIAGFSFVGVNDSRLRFRVYYIVVYHWGQLLNHWSNILGGLLSSGNLNKQSGISVTSLLHVRFGGKESCKFSSSQFMKTQRFAKPLQGVRNYAFDSKSMYITVSEMIRRVTLGGRFI